MMHQFSSLMKHLRRQLNVSFADPAVPEFSKTGRLCIHFMFPYDFHYVFVKESWSENSQAGIWTSPKTWQIDALVS